MRIAVRTLIAILLILAVVGQRGGKGPGRFKGKEQPPPLPDEE